jgi:hypothetical protein
MHIPQIQVPNANAEQFSGPAIHFMLSILLLQTGSVLPPLREAPLSSRFNTRRAVFDESGIKNGSLNVGVPVIYQNILAFYQVSFPGLLHCVRKDDKLPGFTGGIKTPGLTHLIFFCIFNRLIPANDS